MDGKTICTASDEHTFIDEGDIDAEDAVKAINALAGMLRRQREIAATLSSDGGRAG